MITVNMLNRWLNNISVIVTPNAKGENKLIDKFPRQIDERYIPATKLRSRRPCFRSATKTPAVNETAMKYTILEKKIYIKFQGLLKIRLK